MQDFAASGPSPWLWKGDVDLAVQGVIDIIGHQRVALAAGEGLADATQPPFTVVNPALIAHSVTEIDVLQPQLVARGQIGVADIGSTGHVAEQSGGHSA